MSTQSKTKKPASLSGSLVAVKGQATSAAVDVTVPVPAPAAPAPTAGLGYLKSMTVKLDLDRFIQIKRLGLDEGKSSQALIVEAIDMLLASKG